ncbi:phage holin, LLH family [uncultured Tissierella sp.]|uniref:phage holin, LLH family n=1 Tax=uncultured Tissierella sp. TaxID=448160 RepID=UPI002805B2D3|nr:phage holin, LLH family [uncultured Tissierella sp.]MDU5080211.1 phage holin, LLH family [Bacillota bacterium]
MNEGLVKIILGLIGLLGTIVTYVLVPYLKSKTTKEQRENIYFLVSLAVQAAEQIYIKPGQGEKKKEYVINYLNSRGIKLTVEDLNIFIEAAVKELNIIQDKALE